MAYNRRLFVEVGERGYLIDWGYSGTNDPMWDLGNLSVEAGFGSGQDRMVLYKAMSDHFWALWGLIQRANGRPPADFRTYALSRLESCQTLLAGAGFRSHLDAVKAGRRGPASS